MRDAERVNLRWPIDRVDTALSPVKVMASRARRRGPRMARGARISILARSRRPRVTPSGSRIYDRKPILMDRRRNPSTAGRSPYSCFERLAKSAGLNVRVESAGTDPESRRSPPLWLLAKRQGYPAPKSNPRKVTAKDFDQPMW